MKSVLTLLSFTCSIAALPARADLHLSKNGAEPLPVIIAPDAAAPERTAAAELAATLKEITGASFTVSESATVGEGGMILVGPGAAAKAAFADVAFDALAPEEFVIRTNAGKLLLAGGRPRGTLYAVSRFLQDQCGVRWWTPWASRFPKNPSLSVGDLNVKNKPAFEYRSSYWMPAFDAAWAWHNMTNGLASNHTPELGGHVIYKGFVHTFYPLVPPEKHFAAHPEWYSLINGKRTTDHAQLCLTNPALREFVTGRIKEWLRESPDAGIISLSQNDWHGACQCPDCKALDDREGSHSGTMLAFVNDVAERIAPDFPKVAVDTLAYQYTRKPPQTLKPRPNVIVRLCSIECNFREPLDHPSNAAFADDIRGWSKCSERLYVWDYTTNFAHYVQPQPNWFTLGPNLRFFHAHHVRGVFEQGAYQSHGSEMSELRAWVLAQLLWNPQQDDRALIREFLDGYYGAAAPAIGRYLQHLHQASQGFNLTCYAPTDAPYLNFANLSESERLWQEAETAVTTDPERLVRVKLARLPLHYVWISRWDALRAECTAASGKWPLPESRRQAAEQWLAVAAGVEGKPWTKITKINEGGQSPQTWAAPFLQN